MASVNDLAEQFRRWARSSEAVRHGARVCYADLKEVARNSWHPVSEPPTEADADWYGMVAVVAPATEGYPLEFLTMPWDDVDQLLGDYQWARIHNIVLMPEGDGE